MIFRYAHLGPDPAFRARDVMHHVGHDNLTLYDGSMGEEAAIKKVRSGTARQVRAVVSVILRAMLRPAAHRAACEVMTRIARGESR